MCTPNERGGLGQRWGGLACFEPTHYLQFRTEKSDSLLPIAVRSGRRWSGRRGRVRGYNARFFFAPDAFGLLGDAMFENGVVSFARRGRMLSGGEMGIRASGGCEGGIRSRLGAHFYYINLSNCVPSYVSVSRRTRSCRWGWCVLRGTSGLALRGCWWVFGGLRGAGFGSIRIGVYGSYRGFAVLESWKNN